MHEERGTSDKLNACARKRDGRVRRRMGEGDGGETVARLRELLRSDTAAFTGRETRVGSVGTK